MSCIAKITANFTTNCETMVVGGLETNVVLINREDIDLIATTFTANTLVCTNLQLKSGKTGYKIEGVKQSNGKNYSLVIKENMYNKFLHGIKATIFNPTAEGKLNLNNMNGGNFVAVVEQKWKGVGSKDAFEILGFTQGLELTVLTNNSSENDNAILFELASLEGYEEPNVPYNLLETNYATTKTAFDNLFIQAGA